MTRRHKRNRKNQKNRRQAIQARLSMEILEPRQLMTASPVLGPLAQVNLNSSNLTGHLSQQKAAVVSQMDNSNFSRDQALTPFHVSVRQQGSKLRITGTANDDFVEVSQPDEEHVKVTVYEDQERTTVQSTKTFNTSAVTSVVFDGKAGDDYLWNGHEESATVPGLFGSSMSFTYPVEQHSLPTTAYGGTGNDHLEGSIVDDFLYGGPGDDIIYGNAGMDSIKGDADPFRSSPSTMPDGDDVLNGGSGIDRLWGEGGDDTLRGGQGADWLFGNTGDDNLYGEGGDDHLFGQRGLDGLFGGAGKDHLDGGSGPDRYLKHNKGDSFKMKTGDTKIKFTDHSAGRDRGTKWSAGTWTDQDIQKIDGVFRVLHLEMRNTELLKGFTMVRRGSPESLVHTAAWNVDYGPYSFIHIPDGVINDTSDGMYDTIFHEIGHNWDTEHGSSWEWRSLSGWTKRGSGTTSTHQESVLGLNNWRHLRSAEFVSDYAKNNPHDDFSETFSAIFLDKAGRRFRVEGISIAMANNPIIDPGGDNNVVNLDDLDTKREYITDWLDDISS